MIKVISEKEKHAPALPGKMKWRFPNMILIAGDGRNVGKTTLAGKIIRYFSEKEVVTAIKVSPHLHDVGDDLEIIFRNRDFVVAEEKGMSNKDSSLFLQAGAKRVFFIMAKQAFLEEAFSFISDQLDGHVVVVESGGLIELVAPGLFLFVRNRDGRVEKEHYLEYEPLVVMNNEAGFDLELEKLVYKNNRIFLK